MATRGQVFGPPQVSSSSPLTTGHVWVGSSGLATDTNPTGTVTPVFSNTPTLVTPVLGAATATSINFGGSSLSSYIGATSWTPADGSGAALSFTSVSASYKRIGDMVYVSAQFTYPVTADGTAAKVSGLPVTVFNANYAKSPCSIIATTMTATPVHALFTINAATFTFVTSNGGVAVTNAQLSTSIIIMGCWYPAA